MKFLIAVSVVVLAIVVDQANGLCNLCSPLSKKACVSNTTFKYCIDGVPIESPQDCPPETICSSTGPTICVNKGSVQPDCSDCNVCDDSQLFACTDYNAFSLCLGTDKPSNMSYTCPKNLICDNTAPTICVDWKISGLGGTCPWKNITNPATGPSGSITTTPNALLSPDAFCAQKKLAGRYEVAADCKKYISCVVSVTSTSGWLGALYDCPKVSFFDPKTTMCGRDVPSRCNATTVTPTG